jgi:hypothetical protein
MQFDIYTRTGLLIIAVGLLIIFFLHRILPKKTNFKSKAKHSESSAPPAQKIHTETAVLIQKIDQRKRIMNEYHYTKITDSSYQLMFRLENGETLLLHCSKSAHRDVPFQKTGSLTYSNHKLIRFKTDTQVISDGYHTAQL